MFGKSISWFGSIGWRTVFVFALCSVIVSVTGFITSKTHRSKKDKTVLQMAADQERVVVPRYLSGGLTLRCHHPPILLSPPPNIHPAEFFVTFKVNNTGSCGDIVLRRSAVSCGCTSVVKESLEIPAGKIGEFKLRVNTRYAAGQRMESVEYETNSAACKRLRLEAVVDCFPCIEIAVPDKPQTVPELSRKIVSLPVLVRQQIDEPEKEIIANVSGKGLSVIGVKEGQVEEDGQFRHRKATVELLLAPEDIDRPSEVNSLVNGLIGVRVGDFRQTATLVWKIGHPIAYAPVQLFFKMDSGAVSERKTIALKSEEPFMVQRVTASGGVIASCALQEQAMEHAISVEIDLAKVDFKGKNIAKEMVRVVTSKSPKEVEIPVLILLTSKATGV